MTAPRFPFRASTGLFALSTALCVPVALALVDCNPAEQSECQDCLADLAVSDPRPDMRRPDRPDLATVPDLAGPVTPAKDIDFEFVQHYPSTGHYGSMRFGVADVNGV